MPDTRLRRSTDTVRAVLTIWPAALMRLFIGRFITMRQRKSAWPEALPEGVLAVRRGSFVFVQNCTEQPVTVGNTVLERYRTAVWKGMDRIF